MKTKNKCLIKLTQVLEKANLEELHTAVCQNTVGGSSTTYLLKAAGIFMGGLLLAECLLRIHTYIAGEKENARQLSSSFWGDCKAYINSAPLCHKDYKTDDTVNNFYNSLNPTYEISKYRKTHLKNSEDEKGLFNELLAFENKDQKLGPYLKDFFGEWKKGQRYVTHIYLAKSSFMFKNKKPYRVKGFLLGAASAALYLTYRAFKQERLEQTSAA